MLPFRATFIENWDYYEIFRSWFRSIVKKLACDINGMPAAFSINYDRGMFSWFNSFKALLLFVYTNFRALYISPHPIVVTWGLRPVNVTNLNSMCLLDYVCYRWSCEVTFKVSQVIRWQASWAIRNKRRIAKRTLLCRTTLQSCRFDATFSAYGVQHCGRWLWNLYMWPHRPLSYSRLTRLVSSLLYDFSVKLRHGGRLQASVPALCDSLSFEI